MALSRAFTPCRAQVPCVHKSFKTVSQLLENPYLYFCLANAGSPSQFACYPKAVRTGAPPKIKHRTPPPCVRPGSPPGLKFSLRPARPNGPFPFPGDETKADLCKTTLATNVRHNGAQTPIAITNGAVAENLRHRRTRIAVRLSQCTQIALNRPRDTKTRPRIAKKMLSRLRYPNYALLTCGFRGIEHF